MAGVDTGRWITRAAAGRSCAVVVCTRRRSTPRKLSRRSRLSELAPPLRRLDSKTRIGLGQGEWLGSACARAGVRIGGNSPAAERKIAGKTAALERVFAR